MTDVRATTNNVKAGWTRFAFGDVVRNANLTEHDPAAAKLDRIVGLEHLDPENLHIRRWTSPDDGTSFSRKFVPGQTLFGKRRAYQRKVAFAEFEGICSGDILTFEAKDPNVLLPELLPFICQTDAFFDHALGTSAGSLSPRTSWKALQDFEFPLPPIDDQKRIAEILWAADEAVEGWRESLKRLEDLKVRMTLNLMMRGLGNVQFKSTQIGGIPSHWKIAPVGEIANVVRGASPRPKGDKRYYGGHVPRLMVADVSRDGKFVTPRIDTLTEDGAKRLRE